MRGLVAKWELLAKSLVQLSSRDVFFKILCVVFLITKGPMAESVAKFSEHGWWLSP